MNKQELEKDIIVLTLRLLGDDPDTFSEETFSVMKRWQEKARSVLRGEHNYEIDKYHDFYESVACIIAEGSEFMSKIEMYDAIEKEWEKLKEIQ